MTISEMAGWVPAVILPGSTLLQLLQILKEKKIEGVSWVSWLLFAAANLGAYVFTENWFQIQAILAFLLSAVLDVVIVLVYWKLRVKKAGLNRAPKIE